MFGHCFGLVWFPGGAPCNLVMPGCQVVFGHKMKVSESLGKSLGKGVFCPLAPREMGSVGSVLHYSEESDPQWCKAGEKSVFG